MEVGLVRSIDIDHEMQQAYLDYAMSVIVARALPDARDGLKPVHRRILYAMYDMGLRPDSAYKKSARIVGEVLGKYHPHGDMPVYEAMARMAQDFAMRYLLVEGQGNFGSVDGDPPAAMRYTEARLAGPAMEMLADIRKNTVDFVDNFDGSLTEPVVLPAALPNLLVNGATGIAVGMSTNIPPHNLGEVIDALNYMLQNWEKLDDISVEDLMRFIKGPDFPTGGVIIQTAQDEDLQAAYGTGRGKVTVQARVHPEEMERGRSRLIVTELPYMTNKSSLIERIAELAREGRLEGIADLRDESDRQGLRIVIELSKTADPEGVLQELFKNTPMRSTFGIIMLALVDGEPRMLSLKQALRAYLEHRLVIIRRRSEFDLERARQRAHILEGFRVALKNLDEVISLIRNAPDADVARTRLIKRFRLSEIQAQAILDMQLRRLAALERKKIEEEYKAVLAEIKALEALLKSPVKMRQVVAEELNAVKEAYNDRRRTQIVRLGKDIQASAPLLATTSLTPEKTVWVSVTAQGLISRTQEDKPPRMSGNAAPRWILQVSTRDTLYLVTETGEAAALLVQTLPEVENPEEGIPYFKASALSESDKLAALFALPPKDERPEGWQVVTTTRLGLIKKSAISELPGPATKTFTLVKVNEGDQVGWIRLTDGKSEILMVTADGMAIRFLEEEVRSMGLVAAGVGGIKLQGRDEVVGMDLIPKEGDILLVSSDGKAKRLPPEQFPLQGRYGLGVIAWKLPRTAQLAGMAAGKGTQRVILHTNKLAPKSIRLDEAPLQTRAASGKAILDLKAGDRVIDLTIPWEVPRPGRAKEGTAEAEKPVRKPRSRAAITPASPSEEKKPAAARQVAKVGEPKNLVRKVSAKPSQEEAQPAPQKTKARQVKKATPQTQQPLSDKKTRAVKTKKSEPEPVTAPTKTPKSKADQKQTAPPAPAKSRGGASQGKSPEKPKTVNSSKQKEKTSPAKARNLPKARQTSFEDVIAKEEDETPTTAIKGRQRKK